jgi:FRG domain
VGHWTQEQPGLEVADCDTADEFISMIDPASGDWGWTPKARRHQWIFRGHCDSTWTLSPTAWRSPAPPAMIGAIAEVQTRHPEINTFEWRDGSNGMLPNPPAIAPEVARRVGIHASAEFMLITDFIHRCDELGLATPGQLPVRLHEHSILDPRRPIAADDVFAIPDVGLQAALAQHHGVPTRLLDWSDDPLTAAYFASTGSHYGDRIAVWALNETAATTVSMKLWGEAAGLSPVALTLRIVRPSRAANPYLRAQRGSFTLMWGAGCSALVNSGVYPTIDDFVAGAWRPEWEGALLRRVTVPAACAPSVLERLAVRRVTRDALMPSMDVVAAQVKLWWADRPSPESLGPPSDA